MKKEEEIVSKIKITSEITYEDIERQFSKDDLARYNTLCREFVELASNEKNKADLWETSQSRFRTVLDEIHSLRQKYDFLKGEIFFKVWRFKPKTEEYEEICW